MTSINHEWLYQRTGDPFADTGAWALETFANIHHGEPILQLIDRAAKIYISQWGGKINPFFLNSTITQPAFNNERKLDETVKYFKGLLDETAPSLEGYCRILGQNTKLFSAGRNNHIMSGSGTFINFHHAFEPGVMLSKEVLIRIFFVPLGAIFIGNRVGVIGSNSTEFEKSFVSEIVRTNLNRIATGTSEGIFKSPYGNTSNTLFEFVHHWNSELNPDEEEDIEITLYHFTNFGASPEISIYTFSATLFKFYRKVLKGKYIDHWNRFVRSHYKPSKEVVYQEDNDVFVTASKESSGQPLVEDQVKGIYNVVYNNLLNNVSIRLLMVKWCKDQYYKQKQFKFFQIAHLYHQTLFNMKEEALKKIEYIAGIIVENTNKRKKWINTLLMIKNDSGLRDFFITIMREENKHDRTEPVIRLQEYNRYFLADGIYAKETRDLLLISIFEKLCDLNIKEEFESADENSEEASE